MAPRLPLAFTSVGTIGQVAPTDLVQTGWLPNPQGRLTLTSGVPVLTGAVSAAASVIYTPYLGNLVPLWNGSAFVPTTFAEVSQALSDTAKSPAAAVAAQVYDLFGWSDTSTSPATFRVTRGPAWAAGATAGSNVARGSGAGSTALTRVNGLLVNSVAITNGPAANYGTYLGTIATDSSGATVTFNPGAAAAGGTAAVVGLWNNFNRVSTGGFVRDTTSSWTYATTAAWRAANASASARVTFVVGQAEDEWTARYNAVTQASSSGYAATGVGLDTTASYSGTTSFFAASGASSSASSEASAVGVVGQHYLAAIEYTSAGTMTGYGTSGAGSVIESGMKWSGRF